MATTQPPEHGQHNRETIGGAAGHPPSQPWTAKKATKTRSSPRPSSTGVQSSTKSHHRGHHQDDSNATTGGGGGVAIVSPPLSHPVKPQSWSETNNLESPVIHRLRIRDKLRPVSAAVAGKLRQQREKRRTKRRGPYMQSNEGTSTGDEDGELFQMDNVHTTNSSSSTNDQPKQSRYRNSLQQGDGGGEAIENGKAAVAPPSAASRRFSSPAARRMSKSPSDLDADDEDNQDYDSASMVSASELLQARVRALQNPAALMDDDVFNAQFQEIRMQGMQQLAEIEGGGGGAVGTLTNTTMTDPVNIDRPSLIDSASSSIDEQHMGKILSKEHREKSALIQELGQKEQRIYEMEKLVVELNRRLLDSGLENDHLKAENRALLQAMAKLSTTD